MWNGPEKVDTSAGSSGELSFVRDRTQLVEVRVPPLRMVPPVDVLDERAGQAAPRGPRLLMHEPALERREDALHHRIAPAVPATTHVRDRRPLRELVLVRPTRVNAALVRVVQQPRRGLPERRGALPRRQRDARIARPTRGPADHATRAEIEIE